MQPPASRERWILWLPGAACAALLLACAATDGYFGDELYYLACADRLDFGYVDHPPLSIALLAAWTGAFGRSVLALRVLPALAVMVASAGVGVLARQMGAGRFGQLLAAAVMAFAPVQLVIGSFYSMNALDSALWCWAFVVLARVLEAPTTRRWLGLGALLGVALLDKLSVLWLGAGLALGLVLTAERRVLGTRGPWLAAGLALLIASPYAVWQLLHGAPTLAFIANASAGKMVPVGPLSLFGQQLLAMGPGSAPLWLGGLAWLGAGGPAPRFRVHAVVFWTVAAILVVHGTSRPNYLALAQAPLVAAGATGLERLAVGRRRALRHGAVALLALSTALVLPIALPLLPPAQVLAYQRLVGLKAPQMERKQTAALPDHLAYRHGWPELLDAVERAAATLSPDERARAIVLAPAYPEAGAIEQLGRGHGLPPVYGLHNNYFLWGPPPRDPEVVIFLGPHASIAPYVASVERVAQVRCRYCRARLNGMPIVIARHPTRSLRALWPRLASFE